MKFRQYHTIQIPQVSLLHQAPVVLSDMKISMYIFQRTPSEEQG
jgi:hypothetical protein